MGRQTNHRADRRETGRQAGHGVVWRTAHRPVSRGDNPQDSNDASDPGIRNNRAVGPGHLREWVVYLTTLFGIAGVGTGVLWILLDAIGEPMLEPEGVSNSDSLGELIGAGLAGAAFLFAVQVLVLAMLLVLSVVAVFLGAWLGQNVRERNRQTFLTARLSVVAGTAVLFGTVSVLLPSDSTVCCSTPRAS
ncbi:MAG: hypothetical protein J07HX64_02619 [halophilic archaeon J07HX64]|jgi:hypothetical protein|nr:MAG: hypothetical protein J07HX64_02619 [halophilic archaeon J07HX64]